MQDRRQDILDAGLAVLGERGFAGLTQPRVAATAGVRQSHLTYYFPTRADLLIGVAHAAIDRQLAALDAALDGASPKMAPAAIAKAITRPANVRVLLSLVLAADEVPEVRDLFRRFALGVQTRARALLEALQITATDDTVLAVHALSVGLAAVHLATGRSDGERRAAAALQSALRLMKKGDGR